MDFSWLHEVFMVACTVGAFVGSFYLMSRYANRSVNWPSFITSYIGCCLAFAIIGIIPYDVWLSLATKDNNSHLVDRVFLEHYFNACYWTTWWLCWLLCPFLMEYEDAGDFTIRAKMERALARSSRWYVAYLVCGLFVTLYVWQQGDGLHGIPGFILAASPRKGFLKHFCKLLKIMMKNNKIILFSIWKIMMKNNKNHTVFNIFFHDFDQYFCCLMIF